jgi:hypothetical protein
MGSATCNAPPNFHKTTMKVPINLKLGPPAAHRLYFRSLTTSTDSITCGIAGNGPSPWSLARCRCRRQVGGRSAASVNLGSSGGACLVDCRVLLLLLRITVLYTTKVSVFGFTGDRGRRDGRFPATIFGLLVCAQRLLCSEGRLVAFQFMT